MFKKPRMGAAAMLVTLAALAGSMMPLMPLSRRRRAATQHPSAESQLATYHAAEVKRERKAAKRLRDQGAK